MATFCLIHGKWHDSTSWGRLPDLLRAEGHVVVTPDLPYEDPTSTYAERIQPALDALADAGADQRHAAGGSDSSPVVVVGHSLATGYAPLIADQTPDARLVYLCPAPVGPFAQTDAPMRSIRAGFQFPPEREDGTNAWESDRAVAVMYPRLPPDEASALADRLKPGCSPPDAYPLAQQPAVPTTVIYAAHDEFFDPGWSRWIAREVAHVEPIEVDSGHFAMVERPDELARLLSAAARE